MPRAAVLVVVFGLAAAACAADPNVTATESNDSRDETVATTAPEPDATTPAETAPTGTTPDVTASTDDIDTAPLDWRPCDGTEFGPPLDCATLSVPLDHSVVDGERIEIAVARAATADPGERIGSLVFNPGGPGGSGIQFLSAIAPAVPPDLADRFDLVSFDPRGVGDSTALDCAVDFDDDVALLELGDDDGWEALVAESEALVDTCSQTATRLAPLAGTNNAARDLDLLRAALGDEQLSYVGFSYGTRLGATYAELFPDRVRALVLDGAVKPTDDLGEIGLGQGPGFDAAFETFSAACAADPDCSLNAASSVGDATDVYDVVIGEIVERGSLPTDDGERVLTAGEAQLGVVAALYSTVLWPLLADGLLAAATVGDGSLLAALADSYLGRQIDGTYDNSQVAGLLINCADDPARPDVAEVRVRAELVADSSLYFGDFLRASTGCLGTPDPTDPITLGPATGAAPILVIGTTGDPATPYEWSVELAEFLASGVLYTVEGEGHTAFLSIPCVDDVVIDYLVDLELPAAGSGCADDAAVDVFPPAGDGEFEQLIELFDCFRDNGVDVPEIGIGDILADPNGEVLLDALDPTDPEFGAALLACQQFIPGF